jgi:glutamate dehydrogenase
MSERIRTDQMLTRPELSVLLAYAKIDVERAVVSSDLPDDPYLLGDLRSYFPAPVVERFDSLIAEHPLRRELISTMLANDTVNSVGIVFVSRLIGQSGADAAEVVAAYRLARDVTRATDRWEKIEAAFGVIDQSIWQRLMLASDRAVGSLARWYLARGFGGSLGDIVEAHRSGFDQIVDTAFLVGPDDWQRGRAATVDELVAAGVDPALARSHAALPVIVYGADVIEVAATYGHEIGEALDVFLRIGRALGLDHVTRLARQTNARNRWQRWALWTVEEELLAVRRRAAERVLDLADGRRGEDAVLHFLQVRSNHVARVTRFMSAFEPDVDGDVAPLIVALRQARASLS